MLRSPKCVAGISGYIGPGSERCNGWSLRKTNLLWPVVFSPKNAMDRGVTDLPAGACHRPGTLDLAAQQGLLGEIEARLPHAPWFVPAMPRTGKPLSVRMTNFGPLGWVTDKSGGYRYQPTHPATGLPWPPIPEVLIDLWQRFTGYPAMPEACLVNLYQGAARLGSHVDSDEPNRKAPVLSVSLGDDAMFHVGGQKRGDPKVRVMLKSGDVIILGGASREAYHGIDRVIGGTSDLLATGGRINLTLRRVNL